MRHYRLSGQICGSNLIENVKLTGSAILNAEVNSKKIIS
jgi:hypothetical protein